MVTFDRKTIQDLYIRVCRDSGYRLEWDRAAKLTAATGSFHPMDVWMAMSSLDVMMQIAAGEHAACEEKV